MKIDFVALCSAGFEDTLLEELSEIGNVTDIERFTGIIVFSFDGELSRLAKVKTAEDIMIYLKDYKGINRYKTSLRNIRHQTAKIGIMEAAGLLKGIRNFNFNFSVKATYLGRRDYKANEIEEAAAIGIMNSDRSFVFNKSNNLLFRVFLNLEISFIGLSLFEIPLDEKNKVMALPGSLKPSAANSLLRFAGINKGEILLDPMCGTGIIAIEATGYGLRAVAGDINQEKIRLAEKNAKSRGSDASFHVWDARKTGLEPEAVDKVVSNLPFEKQASIIGFDALFFETFLKEMIRVSRKDAVFVFLTRHVELLTTAVRANDLDIIAAMEIKNSGLVSQIIKIKKK